MTMTECYNDILSRRSGEREVLPEISPEEYRRRNSRSGRSDAPG